MSENLIDLVLSLTPEDGSSISNGALMALLQERMPSATDDDYTSTRDALIEDGILGRGRGRGGSVFRIVEELEDNQDQDEEANAFELTPTEEQAPRRRKASGRKAAARRPGGPVQVLCYRHSETRVNNPEVGMVHAGTDPDGDNSTWAYDPHLDPTLNFDSSRAGIEKLIDNALASGDPEEMRDALAELKRLQQPYLNWTGKAEKTSFEIDTVSLHVHERVDPATILANVAKQPKEKEAAINWQQPDLFAAPFENLPLRQALDFYKHEKGWSNRLVVGDSLLVMNSLLTKESMAGKVQMIYIDPPYGIKYGSNFQPFVNKREVVDRSDQDLTQEPEMIKAFRDTWELGIHSYLTYLRNRLLLARELLTDSGSVFVQISDENLHTVRALLDEVFGCSQFVSQITVVKTSSASSITLSGVADYLLWYCKDISSLKYRNLYRSKDLGGVGATQYNLYEDERGARSSIGSHKLSRSDRPFCHDNTTSQRPPGDFPVQFQGRVVKPGKGYWKTGQEGMPRLAKANRFIFVGNTLRYVRFLDDFPVFPFNNVWTDTGTSGFSDPKMYVVQTNATISERCLLMTTDPGDLVLDPTCGSGTTAVVAEKWGRRWITCDTSRVAVALAKQRLMTGSFDYYALRYPEEGIKGGFDYETVPHITLKSIANNSDIDTIWDEDHPKITAILDCLNATLAANPPKPLRPVQGARKGKLVELEKGDTLEEWEVPFDWPEDWPMTARSHFDAFHSARKALQRRMDQSISDHADQETLYDRPRINRDRQRIVGPFSVEAVPAPTILSLDETMPLEEADETIARYGETSRQTMWRNELLKTGLRGKGGAMLHLAEIETLPGLKYIHASGSLSETGERIVVSFGPEHAALEQRQVELALSEAETLRPAPKFVLFCAFTFDPEAAKDIDEVNWPGVTLLKAQMNTDLLTEDLKKKRASNQSFWLMGQPDVDLRKRQDGMWEVEVNGFDYFNPKEGDLVSGGKTKIAMWSLDTDYDQRSLMPHQVFFPMSDAKGGWNRLRKTVRAELDEDLLDQFHGTVSLPFVAGDNRRIAVKIVDDRGIESLKIMPLEG